MTKTRSRGNIRHGMDGLELARGENQTTMSDCESEGNDETHFSDDAASPYESADDADQNEADEQPNEFVKQLIDKSERIADEDLDLGNSTNFAEDIVKICISNAVDELEKLKLSEQRDGANGNSATDPLTSLDTSDDITPLESDVTNGDIVGEKSSKADANSNEDAEASASTIDHTNPTFVPKSSSYFCHDERGELPVDEKPSTGKKSRASKVEKWGHDRYDERKQAPKTESELTADYGYNIRKFEKPPGKDFRRPNNSRNDNFRPPNNRKVVHDFLTDIRSQTKPSKPVEQPLTSSNTVKSKPESRTKKIPEPQGDEWATGVVDPSSDWALDPQTDTSAWGAESQVDKKVQENRQQPNVKSSSSQKHVQSGSEGRSGGRQRQEEAWGAGGRNVRKEFTGRGRFDQSRQGERENERESCRDDWNNNKDSNRERGGFSSRGGRVNEERWGNNDRWNGGDERVASGGRRGMAPRGRGRHFDPPPPREQYRDRRDNRDAGGEGYYGNRNDREYYQNQRESQRENGRFEGDGYSNPRYSRGGSTRGRGGFDSYRNPERQRENYREEPHEFPVQAEQPRYQQGYQKLRGRANNDRFEGERADAKDRYVDSELPPRYEKQEKEPRKTGENTYPSGHIDPAVAVYSDYNNPDDLYDDRYASRKNPEKTDSRAKPLAKEGQTVTNEVRHEHIAKAEVKGEIKGEKEPPRLDMTGLSDFLQMVSKNPGNLKEAYLSS